VESKFLVQIVHKKTGQIVQWAPGRQIEREFETEVCARVLSKLEALTGESAKTTRVVEVQAPTLHYTPVEPALQPRSFGDRMWQFFGLSDEPAPVDPVYDIQQGPSVPQSVEVDVDVAVYPTERVVTYVREALKETFYSIKADVRP
jgi:hypothetical protein